MCHGPRTLNEAINFRRCSGYGTGAADGKELAAVYATAEQQQAAQTPGVDHPARRLAVHAIAGFFSALVTADRPQLKLVVDNRTPDPAGKAI